MRALPGSSVRRDGDTSEAMSQHTRRYSERQRDAVLRAVLVDGLSVAEAHRHAVAGELPGVPAFALTYRSAVAIVAKGRDSFDAQQLQDPAEAHAALDDDALAIAGRTHQAVTILRRGDKLPDGLDLVALKKAADAVAATRRALPPRRAPKTTEPADQDAPPTQGDDVLARMLRGDFSGPNEANGTNGATVAEGEHA
jgi:hypothetical protein